MFHLRAKSLSFFLLFLVSPFVLAQTSTTSVRGLISDPQGAVIPNASVTITEVSTGASRSTTSNAQGEYQFLQVVPGTYAISASATGFSSAKADSVHLLVATPATVNLKLPLPGATEVVRVEGETPTVNTQDASIGNAFNTTQIMELPLEGRDPVGILSLQPGVAFVGNSVDQSFDSRGGSVNGARSDQSNITLDGIDDNDQNLGLAFTGALRSTLDSLQEFRVTTTNSNADSGRSSGAQVNLLTKSGTNQFHGTVYEYNRNTWGVANDWFNKRAQIEAGEPNRPGKLIRNTYGGSIGGPIIKDRMFFFGTYEGQRTRESLQTTRTVPSLLLRQGVMQYQDQNGNVIQLSPADLAAMDPNCTGLGTCPLGPGANPAVLKVLQSYPVPNTTSVGDGLDFQGFTFAAPVPSNLNTYIAKVDFNLTSRQTLFIRGNLQNDNVVPANSTAVAQFPGQPASITDKNNAKGIAVGHTWMMSNNVVNNARYGLTRVSLGSSGLQSQGFVQFRGMDFPQAFTSTSTSVVPVHNVMDDISWIRGNHTLQFGGNYRRIDNTATGNRFSFINAETNPSWLTFSGFAQTGQSLDPGAFGHPDVGDDFTQSYDLAIATLAGVISEGFSNYNRDKTGGVLGEGAPAARHFRTNELEFYGQDAWHVRPNFTITGGVRYSLLQPPYEINGVQVAPTIDLHNWFQQRGAAMLNGQTYDATIPFDLAGQANGRKPYWDWDYKDIAPRIAFAYSPSSDSGLMNEMFGNGKTSIRGGFGLYYDHFGEGVVNTFDQYGSFGLTTQLGNAAGVLSPDTAPRFSGLNTVPSSVVIPPPASGFPFTPPTTVDSGGFAITWGMDNKLKTPYAEVVDFSIQRELPKNFVFETAYIGRFAHRLLQEEDLAMPLNIRDPKSGMDYFQAATLLMQAAQKGVPVQSLAKIPYWENMFPAATGVPFQYKCAPGAKTFSGSPTATQAIYDVYACNVGNETTPLSIIDAPGESSNDGLGNGPCFPACSVLGPFAYFNPQFSSLYAWSSVGNSAYHGGQFMLRHRGNGLQFDLNYTFSKSMDVGSNAERINEFQGFGFASQIINSWSPKQLRAVSDFDTTHQVNTNFVYDLPFGTGRRWGNSWNGIANTVLGGWTLTGIYRWTSGYPFGVAPGLGFWGTNWQLTSSLMSTGQLPKTGVFTDANGNPNVFQASTNKDADATLTNVDGGPFRLAFPGESGQRNNLRGPGFFNMDNGIHKTFKITERQNLQFTWQVFNVLNAVRFDVGSMQNIGNNSISSGATFGEFTSTLTQPRHMEFALRYSF